MSDYHWDKVVDFVIVGSGAGAVCASLVAKDHGLDALIVEKLDVFGGCTAYSGGALWIPNNHLMENEGAGDSLERSMQYLDAAIWYDGPATTQARRLAFLEHGRKALEYLASKGMKMRRTKHWPDYHSDLPGAEQGTRVVMAQLFDLNELGEWKLRLAQSKMMPIRFNIDELSTLLLVKRTWRAKWTALQIALGYLFNKLAGREMRGAGVAWQGRMLQIALREQLPLWLDSPVDRLIEENGRVIGVEARREGKPCFIRARRGVLLNAGGFTRNTEMRERYGRKPVFAKCTNTPPGDTGEMMESAMTLGAATDCMDEGLWNVSSMGPGETFPEAAADGTPLPLHHHWDISLPHVILVDQDGQRFCNESSSYMEVGQRLYQRHNETGKGIPAWAIIESRHRNRYVWGSVMGKTPQSWLDSGYMKQAATLEDLARQCGIDAAGLKDTVTRFNSSCRAGVDDEFKRGAKAFDLAHGDPTVKPNASLGAIEVAPFYAVAIYPGDVGTWGGLVTDEHARVLKTNGEVIEGLYATGTTAAHVFGRTYAGAGASVGPSLTFGYIAALHVANMKENTAARDQVQG